MEDKKFIKIEISLNPKEETRRLRITFDRDTTFELKSEGIRKVMDLAAIMLKTPFREIPVDHIGRW